MISADEYLFYMLLLNALTFWMGFLRGRTVEIKNKIAELDKLIQGIKKAGSIKPGGIV